MKKPVIITIVVLVIAIIAVVTIVVMNMNTSTNPSTKLNPINKAEDLVALVDKIYEGQDKSMIPPSVQTQIIDVTDEETVKYVTGIDNVQNVEFVVTSEPMISSQAYSLVLVKVKDGVNANEVAKKMSENINTKKWVCVSAEKLYATNSGNVVCLVMTNEKTAKLVYERFKTLAGTIGQEYEKTEVEDELPPEMF